MSAHLSRLVCPTVPKMLREAPSPSSSTGSEAQAVAVTRSVRCTERGGQSWLMFDARDIGRFWAADKYTWFWWPWQPYSGLQVCDDSLATLERDLAPLGFVRVHRRELVNLRFVRRVMNERRGAQLSLWDGQVLDVSRRATAKLRLELKELERRRPAPCTPMAAGLMTRRLAS